MEDSLFTKKQGAELGKLAKTLFDKATDRFYKSISIELTAGLLGVIVGLADISEQSKIAFASLGFLLLAAAYCYKIKFEETYENAETMRRQSVLTIGLGWQIRKTQFSEWRMFAGKKILDEIEKNPLESEYYATEEQVGTKRLLEMTQESAFWTRHLYCYLRSYFWVGFFLSALLFLLVLTVSTSGFIQQSLASKIVYVTYLILPLILSLDLLNWGARLNRLIGAVRRIEDNLEKIEDDETLDEKQILRMVFEYNCQLVTGFPIPVWFYKKYRGHIQFLWDKRNDHGQTND